MLIEKRGYKKVPKNARSHSNGQLYLFKWRQHPDGSGKRQEPCSL